MSRPSCGIVTKHKECCNNAITVTAIIAFKDAPGNIGARATHLSRLGTKANSSQPPRAGRFPEPRPVATYIPAILPIVGDGKNGIPEHEATGTKHGVGDIAGPGNGPAHLLHGRVDDLHRARPRSAKQGPYTPKSASKNARMNGTCSENAVAAPRLSASCGGTVAPRPTWLAGSAVPGGCRTARGPSASGRALAAILKLRVLDRHRCSANLVADTLFHDVLVLVKAAQVGQGRGAQPRSDSRLVALRLASRPILDRAAGAFRGKQRP